MCPQGREHIKQEIEYEKSRLLPYQNTPYYLDEHDTLFRLQKSIRCLVRRFYTSYPTGGYAVSGGLPEHNTFEKQLNNAEI
ncbi:hypothetical protein Tco_0478654 [Tanacetum coccineum]